MREQELQDILASIDFCKLVPSIFRSKNMLWDDSVGSENEERKDEDEDDKMKP